jgi:hypothetical protein
MLLSSATTKINTITHVAYKNYVIPYGRGSEQSIFCIDTLCD